MELSITRIALLMKKQVIESKKLYLFGVLAMMGIMSFVFMMSISGNHGFRINEQGAFFGVGMISFGCLFALTLFSKLDNAKGRTQQFTLPATILEKLACAIIYGAVLFPIMYIITVYPILRLTNYVDNNYMGSINEAYTFNTKDETLIPLTVFYILQAFVLLLSVYFKQYKVVKSVVLICLIFFGSIFIYSKIVFSFFPIAFSKEITVTYNFKDEDQSLVKKIGNTFTVNQTFSRIHSVEPFGELRYFSSKTYVGIELPICQQIGFFFLSFLSIPFMWLITWFRLKESEVY